MQEMRRLLAEASRDGNRPSLQLFVQALHCCHQTRQWRLVCRFIQEMWDLGPEPDAEAYDLALRTLFQQSLEESGVRRDASFLYQWYMHVLREAHRRGSELSSDAFRNATWICCRTKSKGAEDESDHVDWLLDRVRRQDAFFPDTLFCRRLMKAVQATSRWSEALELLAFAEASLPRDENFYELAARACAISRRWEHALVFLQEACESELVTDAATASAVFACSKAFKWEMALNVMSAHPGPTDPAARWGSGLFAANVALDIARKRAVGDDETEAEAGTEAAGSDVQ